MATSRRGGCGCVRAPGQPANGWGERSAGQSLLAARQRPSVRGDNVGQGRHMRRGDSTAAAWADGRGAGGRWRSVRRNGEEERGGMEADAKLCRPPQSAATVPRLPQSYGGQPAGTPAGDGPSAAGGGGGRLCRLRPLPQVGRRRCATAVGGERRGDAAPRGFPSKLAELTIRPPARRPPRAPGGATRAGGRAAE